MEFYKHIKPLAGESDWPVWKHKIRDLLDYHEGALDVIDGKLVKPEDLKKEASDKEVKEHKLISDLFRKSNSYAKSMIASSVTDTVYQKIMDQETAFDAWNMLKQQFEASSKDQLFKICSDFFSFGWVDGDDISMHIAKLKSLWNELNNGLKSKNEVALPELLLVCKTLNILPSSFISFKSSWMLLKDDQNKTFDDLTIQLCSFERSFMKQEGISSVSQERQEALIAANAKKNKSKAKPKPNKSTCNYCKKVGHWVKDCEKWISDGRPRKPQPVSATDVAGLMFVEEEALSADSSTHPSRWWIDNGATRHVTNCDSYYMDFKKFENPSGIKAAGTEVLPAIGKGTVRVRNLTTGEEFLLKDVWYVPNLCRNLFSVLAAQDRNPKSIFQSTAKECRLLNQGKLMLNGSREQGGTLFEANIEPVLPTENPEVNFVDNKLQLYHERWGHQDKKHVLARIQKDLHLKVLKEEKQLCEPCIYGKAHRMPFGNREKSTKPGELFSADVCGPFEKSYNKKRYLVVFKDNYTKFRYGYLMSEKSEVKEMLKKVLQHAKMLGHSIREMISDNGGEMDNKEIREILSNAGVTQRLTAPYTPQQNAICERDFRTIVEMARTFKYSNSDLVFPEAMWAELVATSLYILNRTGKSSVEGISPYELWIGKKPRIKHLRIIGSVCYAHIPDERRKKMDKKAIKGYLIGYDGDERYRIWVKEENKVILSRDVLFQERLSHCEYVKLPLRDLKVQDDKEEKSEESESTESSDSEYYDYDSVDEEKEDPLTQISNRLRDRSKLSKPAHLQDYVMFGEESVFQITTPESYEEALSGNDKDHWKEAMDNEIKSLKENHTWKLASLPKGSRVIPSKWVYRVKMNPDGSVDKYKARVVIKGYSQRYGIDYNETFSPVAKLSTIRAMLSVAAREKLHLIQFDVSTAFLYGHLDEDIYMEQPEGYTDGTKKVCKLQKSLYGLKQAPRCWNKRFSTHLKETGFRISETDPCLHIRGSQDDKMIMVALFVDDGLVMAKSQEEAELFIEELKKEFKITVKPASYFLGLEIERFEDGSIKICQQAYARKLLERFKFSECKPVSTPMVKIGEHETKECDKNNTFPYREAVGALMYLMIGTRPDLAYSVSVLSRTLDCSSTEDVVKLKRVFRYIAGTCSMGIVFRADGSSKLSCYSDADFGGCNKTGRSTSGVVVTYAGGAVSWLSQRQKLTATSTTEAELVAANEAVKEIIWLSRLYEEMGCPQQVPILQIDNQATIRLCHNPENHHRTKHIRIKYFFIREKVSEGALQVQYISTEEQIADIMTKPLPKDRLVTLSKKLGLLNNSVPKVT